MLLKGSIRHRMGGIYLHLADRFDLSSEKRKELEKLLDEPDGDVYYQIEWEHKARNLFDVWKDDRILFYGSLMGIIQHCNELQRQAALN